MSRQASTRSAPVSSSKNPIISAWSAICGFGIGRSNFTAGVAAGRRPLVSLDSEVWPAPIQQACLVPEFDARAILGRKGTRSMDRATALAIVAVGDLLKQGDDYIAGIDDQTALVLGTSTGSTRSIMSFTRDSLTEDKPYFVDPSRFPNTVMNCAAGHSAIWHGLHGPNVTVAGGRASALLAMSYARRLLRSGRAHSVVFGAVEEFSAERSWIDWHARGRPERPAGEGCAVLLLENEHADSREPLAEVLAVEVRLAADGDDEATQLAHCMHRAIRKAGLSPGDVWAVVPSGSLGSDGEHERQAIDDVFGAPGPASLPCTELLGDTNSATAAFQIATALAAAEASPEAVGRAVLVTAIDVDGVVGCALLHLMTPSPNRDRAPVT